MPWLKETGALWKLLEPVSVNVPTPVLEKPVEEMALAMVMALRL